MDADIRNAKKGCGIIFSVDGYTMRCGEIGFGFVEPFLCDNCAGRKKVNSMDLKELLTAVDLLFDRPDENKSPYGGTTYRYSINRKLQGFYFSVVDKWQNWIAAGYETDFGPCLCVEDCIKEFLEYIKENDINVLSLMDDLKACEARARAKGYLDEEGNFV